MHRNRLLKSGSRKSANFYIMIEPLMKKASLLPIQITSLNLRTGVPLYKRIYEELRQAILNGRLDVGSRLPASRDLADDLGVSRNTILGSYQQLFAEGYIEGHIGSGTFVARTLPEEMLEARTERAHIDAEPNLGRQLSQRGRKLTATSPNLIDSIFGKPIPFRSAIPDLSNFPFDVWARLMSKHNREPSLDMLSYAHPAGFPRLREVVAEYLKSSRAVRCVPEQVIIIPGAQVALEIICQILLDKGETTLVEDPGYFGVRAALARGGVRIVPIPIDRDGISIQAIRKIRSRPSLVYVTPSHQFPLGVTMSLSRRLELLDWARQKNIWIIEDDCDGEYRYDGRPIPSLQGLDSGHQVIYIGTFSKVLFPSLRIGYMIVPLELVNAFVTARVMVDLQSSTIPQAVLADFIQQGHFASHVRRMRKLYAQRQKYFVCAADSELRGLIEIEKSEAGMHLIGWLPHGKNDRNIARAALHQKLMTHALSAFALKPLHRGALVLGYTAFNERQILSGIRRLASILRKN
jgi:GntR family transcriptional regulator/MocR family aminotransferase